jgi:hypothetical protein
LDIAKRWFQVHAVQADGSEVLNKKLARNSGSTVVGTTIERAVMTAIYLCANARVQTAIGLSGNPQFMTAAEIELTRDVFFSDLSMSRA